ncbi:MAG: alpha-1,4-glucan--maltose-1-phosphate maltosyltransferase [Candidatus Acidiferrales bacterium]
MTNPNAAPPKLKPLLPLRRVVIEGVRPQVDDGRFPIKRTAGESATVTADIHSDGHDQLRAVLLHKAENAEAWTETEMQPRGNDAWSGEFRVEQLGPYRYTVQAWVDEFRTWRRDVARKLEAAQDVAVDALAGAELLSAASPRAQAQDAKRLGEIAQQVRELAKIDAAAAIELAQSEECSVLMDRYPDRSDAATYTRELAVTVDRQRARFSAWYEMFPRSCSDDPARHGAFDDCMRRLDYIASMNFDILYLPPIHPIGRTHRKGRNNNPVAEPDAVGSPWAIGAEEGGHKTIHPQLGTLEGFHRLVARAKELGMEIALDLAFQCAPDHPYVREHREWFKIRPDGTVQYAENPPKTYQDIYPLNFSGAHSAELCEELKSIVDYWITQGIRIFRVDNPHTKPYAFWEWLIADVKRRHPDVIFLSEAFTRPKVMYRLAKLGFTQSYTYFAWRNTKRELTQYFTELTRAEVRDFFRPNLWPNTPDILTEYLQYGGRPAFMARLVLAATLGANYGIYGPAFELCENRAARAGSEEYLDSEKYQLRAWEIDRADSLRPLIARVNRIRRENPALQGDASLRFLEIDNEQLIAYSKASSDLSNIVIVLVNLDPHHTQSGWLELPLEPFGLAAGQSYQAHDLLTDARFLWSGARNFVQVDPKLVPAHILRIRRRIRTERDFDYFM